MIVIIISIIDFYRIFHSLVFFFKQTCQWY